MIVDMELDSLFLGSEQKRNGCLLLLLFSGPLCRLHPIRPSAPSSSSHIHTSIFICVATAEFSANWRAIACFAASADCTISSFNCLTWAARLMSSSFSCASRHSKNSEASRSSDGRRRDDDDDDSDRVNRVRRCSI